jgi:hypothetical protein
VTAIATSAAASAATTAARNMSKDWEYCAAGECSSSDACRTWLPRRAGRTTHPGVPDSNGLHSNRITVASW